MDITEKKRIIELPRTIADKIAAGEVVERPLSIVKELVENAIDSGANSIIVEIRNGGKTYIRVTDNGCGIEKEDVELAFKRHATSKIKHAEDLDSITSLGFRGEALASIAAVSRTELISKTAGEKSGIRIILNGGEIAEKSDIGCPEGTTVIIEDLFYNTPARLKFLKQDATESTLIIDFISKMALAYSHIKIRLINNGNLLFSTPGKGDIYTCILTVYSREIGEKLIHLHESGEEMSLEAFVSSPGQSKTNRKSQVFFVNGRYVHSKVLENAVTEAYVEKLAEGRYPIAFLFLQVEPGRLDVNIHPNKKEVRFDNEKKVTTFAAEAIQKHLNTNAGVVELKQDNFFKFRKTDDNVNIARESLKKPDIAQEIISLPIKETFGNVRENDGDYRIKADHPENNGSITGNHTKIADHSESGYLDINKHAPEVQPFNIGAITLTGSIFGTYITGIDERHFYLIDQHAAHERITYEQLLDQYYNEEKLQQTILTPFVVNVSHALKNAAQDALDLIEKLGYQIEEFGPKAYIVKAVPLFMEFEEAKNFLTDIFDNISEEIDVKNQHKIQKIISNACKKSVKAHDVLDIREMEQLLRDLSKTRNPFSCPHGRPTFIKLSKAEIEKMFKRA